VQALTSTLSQASASASELPVNPTSTSDSATLSKEGSQCGLLHSLAISQLHYTTISYLSSPHDPFLLVSSFTLRWDRDIAAAPH